MKEVNIGESKANEMEYTVIGNQFLPKQIFALVLNLPFSLSLTSLAISFGKH